MNIETITHASLTEEITELWDDVWNSVIFRTNYNLTRDVALNIRNRVSEFEISLRDAGHSEAGAYSGAMHRTRLITTTILQ